MKNIRRWRFRGDPDELEVAKAADVRASEHLERARENARKAKRLLIENHLTARFLREIRENHA